MEAALVEPLSLADREEIERVRVVRDEQDARLDRLAVDRDAERLPVLRKDRERAQAGERVAAAPMPFPTAHELRVETERHVVQEQAAVRPGGIDSPLLAVHECVERTDRVAAVEADVACEVV